MRRQRRKAPPTLARRVASLERRVSKIEGVRKRIGFQATEVQGDREEQDDLDDDFTPDEVP